MATIKLRKIPPKEVTGPMAKNTFEAGGASSEIDRLRAEIEQFKKERSMIREEVADLSVKLRRLQRRLR